FFSSRRRHTRSKRDWSSDVCSSDLEFSQFPDDTAAETAQSYYCKFFIHRSFPLHDLSDWMTLILVAVSSLDIILIEQEQPEQKKIGRASCRERVTMIADTRAVDTKS